MKGTAAFLKETESPDLILVYHTGVEDKVNGTDWGHTYGSDYWGWGGRAVDVYRHREGTRIVELTDADTQRLVWRGSAQAEVYPEQVFNKLQENINKVVKKVFDEVPPG